MKITVESCTSICIAKLQTSIKKQILQDYVDPNPDEIYSYTKQELDNFTTNGQTFKYWALPNVFGGHRWFFLCPKCSTKATKLFLPPENSPMEKKYLCKACHKLKNQSAVMGHNKLYKNVFQPMKRMKEIEDKLDRGYLGSDTVQKLLDEYDVLEKKMQSCQEYRLYKFKKKRELDT